MKQELTFLLGLVNYSKQLLACRENDRGLAPGRNHTVLVGTLKIITQIAVKKIAASKLDCLTAFMRGAEKETHTIIFD